ncbi:hypothetical protein AB0M57_35220 [Streptomyces sp. NPDC051597]|uniref:hypothetical protein n=1 Tax=Streptomyces sp. NPDC051597 TaxID=3155049 RepID=UPI0034343EF1
MKKKLQYVLTSTALTATIVGSIFTSSVPAHAIPNVSCGPITDTDSAAAARLNQQLTGSLRGYLTAYRVSCARAIVNAVQDRRLPERASVIAVTTAIVESLLENNPNVIDHTSVGLFQQQKGWGSTAERLNPTWATNAFLDKMLRLYPNGSWQSQQIGVVAQAVQESQFGERYQPQAPDAQKIVSELVASTPMMVRQVGGASVYNPDTRTAEVFTLGLDGAMGHSYSTEGAAWSDWCMINGSSKFRGVPSVVHNPATNALELFAVGKDRGMYHAYWVASSGWSNWSRFGDWTFSGSPVSVYNPDTRTAEVFALGEDGTMAHSYSTDGGAWSDWSMIDGASKFTGVPSVVHNPATNALELFAVGKDRGMYHAYWVASSGWSGWSRFGDWTFGGSPVSVYDPDTRTAEVFALGEDGAMGHSYSTDGGAWSGWSMIDGASKFAGAPSVVHNPVTRALELFAVGKDSVTYHAYWTPTGEGWSTWGAMNGSWKFTGSPTTTYNRATNAVELFATGTDGNTNHAYYQNGWSDWHTVAEWKTPTAS